MSATIAPGGTGKSSVDLTEAIAMATARNLLGEQPEQRLRVWYHNGEDDRDEIDRRILAICQHYGIPQEELEGWLFVTSGAEVPLRVAAGYSNLEINEVLVRQLREAIGDLKLDVAMLDPLITLHGVPEGDNGKMYGSSASLPISATSWIAPSSSRTTRAKGRPATSLRIQRRRHPRRVGGPGRGAGRPGPQPHDGGGSPGGRHPGTRPGIVFPHRPRQGQLFAAGPRGTWRQFVSVDLPNDDDVGVVAPWEFPGQGVPSPEKAAAEHKAEQVFLQLLDKFAARGVNVSANAGATYAPAKFAAEREAAVAEVSKAALVAAMRRLLDSGRIRSEEHGRGRSSPGPRRVLKHARSLRSLRALCALFARALLPYTLYQRARALPGRGHRRSALRAAGAVPERRQPRPLCKERAPILTLRCSQEHLAPVVVRPPLGRGTMTMRRRKILAAYERALADYAYACAPRRRTPTRLRDRPRGPALHGGAWRLLHGR